MTKIIKTILAAGTMIAAASSMPSSAQVSGMATANPAFAIAKSKPFAAAYTSIDTQYKSFTDQVRTRSQTIQNLQKQLDANNDGQLSQAEVDAAQNAKNPAIASIQTENREIQKLRAPAIKAQMFALEEILKQYNPAQQTVVAAKKINVILSPEVFLYAPPAADVTNDITAAIDARIPTVATTPPADWNPQRGTVSMHQQIQQLLQASAASQSRQQQAQPAAAQPSGR